MWNTLSEVGGGFQAPICERSQKDPSQIGLNDIYIYTLPTFSVKLKFL